MQDKGNMVSIEGSRCSSYVALVLTTYLAKVHSMVLEGMSVVML